MITPYEDGYTLGERNGQLPDSTRPTAVSIPSRYLGELPKAWDGWSVAAHQYTEGYSAGWEAGRAKLEAS